MDAKEILAERDRFVGFAFAAADLLVELDARGAILAAHGAAQSLLGYGADRLHGQLFLDLVVPGDRPLVRRLLATLASRRNGGRLDPIPLRVARGVDAEIGVLLGGCKLPSTPDATLLTLATLPMGDGRGTTERDPDSGLLNQDEFLSLTAKHASSPNAKRQNMLMVRINGLTAATQALPEEEAKELMAEVGGALRALSAGSDSAARLADDEFGLIEEASRPAAGLVEREIAGIARDAGLPDDALKTDLTSVEMPPASTPETTALAIAYAVKIMTERRGDPLSVGTLQRNLPNAVSAAIGSTVSLQTMIRRGEIKLVYQPIVSLNNRELHHHEALTRFPDGRNTFEAIRFAEAVGLTEELDILVCRLALQELRRVGGSASVAVNVSGRSMTNDSFRRALLALLEPVSAGERRRLLFELTESTLVESMEDASNFLSQLKRAGHAVCLDDFGAGAAAYSYLRHFDVDIVKIDGPFLKAALLRDRERALIRSVCRLCRDLDCEVIGEMIEDEREAEAAARLGVDFGQGWLFGKPAPELPYIRAVGHRSVLRTSAA